MRYKNDITKYIKDNIEDMVESHFDCWKDRYYRMSKADVLFDLHYNYDFSCDIECVADGIGRELTADEEEYVIDSFCKTVKNNFYKGMK